MNKNIQQTQIPLFKSYEILKENFEKHKKSTKVGSNSSFTKGVAKRIIENMKYYPSPPKPKKNSTSSNHLYEDTRRTNKLFNFYLPSYVSNVNRSKNTNEGLEKYHSSFVQFLQSDPYGKSLLKESNKYKVEQLQEDLSIDEFDFMFARLMKDDSNKDYLKFLDYLPIKQKKLFPGSEKFKFFKKSSFEFITRNFNLLEQKFVITLNNNQEEKKNKRKIIYTIVQNVDKLLYLLWKIFGDSTKQLIQVDRLSIDGNKTGISIFLHSMNKNELFEKFQDHIRVLTIAKLTGIGEKLLRHMLDANLVDRCDNIEVEEDANVDNDGDTEIIEQNERRSDKQFLLNRLVEFFSPFSKLMEIENFDYNNTTVKRKVIFNPDKGLLKSIIDYSNNDFQNYYKLLVLSLIVNFCPQYEWRLCQLLFNKMKLKWTTTDGKVLENESCLKWLSVNLQKEKCNIIKLEIKDNDTIVVEDVLRRFGLKNEYVIKCIKKCMVQCKKDECHCSTCYCCGQLFHLYYQTPKNPIWQIYERETFYTIFKFSIKCKDIYDCNLHFGKRFVEKGLDLTCANCPPFYFKVQQFFRYNKIFKQKKAEKGFKKDDFCGNFFINIKKTCNKSGKKKNQISYVQFKYCRTVIKFSKELIEILKTMFEQLCKDNIINRVAFDSDAFKDVENYFESLESIWDDLFRNCDINVIWNKINDISDSLIKFVKYYYQLVCKQSMVGWLWHEWGCHIKKKCKKLKDLLLHWSEISNQITEAENITEDKNIQAHTSHDSPISHSDSKIVVIKSLLKLCWLDAEFRNKLRENWNKEWKETLKKKRENKKSKLYKGDLFINEKESEDDLIMNEKEGSEKESEEIIIPPKNDNMTISSSSGEEKMKITSNGEDNKNRMSEEGNTKDFKFSSSDDEMFSPYSDINENKMRITSNGEDTENVNDPFNLRKSFKLFTSSDDQMTGSDLDPLTFTPPITSDIDFSSLDNGYD